jgi:hypothetical protein
MKKGTIVPRGILTLCLTFVLLAVTAGSASAYRFLTPASTDFANRQVGTTSPAQLFTLKVTCDSIPIIINGQFIQNVCFRNDSFNPSISIGGSDPANFGQTNGCGSTMVGSSLTGVSCQINVTFTPLSVGPKQGTLSTGGPTATLAGTGVTTPTPATPPTPGAAPPLTLILDAHKQALKKTLKFSATANHDCGLGASGSIKTTVVQLAAGVKTRVTAKLKSKARKQLARKLAEFGKAKATVQGSCTDQNGVTQVDKIKVKLTD